MRALALLDVHLSLACVGLVGLLVALWSEMLVRESGPRLWATIAVTVGLAGVAVLFGLHAITNTEPVSADRGTRDESVEVSCDGKLGAPGIVWCSRVGRDVSAAEITCGECGWWHLKFENLTENGSHVGRPCHGCERCQGDASTHDGARAILFECAAALSRPDDGGRRYDSMPGEIKTLRLYVDNVNEYEWLCSSCRCVYPSRPGGLVFHACPDCGRAMHPTSDHLRQLETIKEDHRETRRQLSRLLSIVVDVINQHRDDRSTEYVFVDDVVRDLVDNLPPGTVLAGD